MLSIRYEDRLDGVSNYLPWKVRMIFVLKEWTIWTFANTKVTKPTNKYELEVHEMLEARDDKVIINGVKDHIILHLVEKKTTKYVWYNLT